MNFFGLSGRYKDGEESDDANVSDDERPFSANVTQDDATRTNPMGTEGEWVGVDFGNVAFDNVGERPSPLAPKRLGNLTMTGGGKTSTTPATAASRKKPPPAAYPSSAPTYATGARATAGTPNTAGGQTTPGGGTNSTTPAGQSATGTPTQRMPGAHPGGGQGNQQNNSLPSAMGGGGFAPPPLEGLRAAIAATPGVFDGAAQKRELDWQANVKGDTAKTKEFRDDVLADLNLRTFVFMKAGTPIVQLLHSATTFRHPVVARELKNSQIGFVGDRVGWQMPLPVCLPPTNAWTWTTVKIVDDPVKMETEGGKEELWTPSDTSTAQDITLPRLLHIPLALADIMLQGQYTPQTLHAAIAGVISAPNATLTDADCKVMLKWCVAASQDKGGGESVLAIKLESAFSADPGFGTWVEQRLNSTLGVQPSQPPPPTLGGFSTPASMGTAIGQAAVQAVRQAGGAAVMGGALFPHRFLPTVCLE